MLAKIFMQEISNHTKFSTKNKLQYCKYPFLHACEFLPLLHYISQQYIQILQNQNAKMKTGEMLIYGHENNKVPVILKIILA